MASNILFSFFRQYIYYLLVFQFTRLLFLLSFLDEAGSESFTEIVRIFYHSLYLDNSSVCYILSIPFLLVTLQTIIKWKHFHHINFVYACIIILTIFIITISEIPIYREWHVKLSFKAFSYLQNPSEVIRSAKYSDIITGLASIIIFTTAWCYAYKRLVHTAAIIQKRNIPLTILFFLLVPFIIGPGIRGGLQPIPIHQSDVYFSKNNFLNLATVNSPWNLMASITKNFKYKNSNPFIYRKMDDALKTRDSLYYYEKDTFPQVLTTTKPNIALIILESWPADIVKGCGDYDSITPNFNKLAGDGLLFTDIYASGSLSDQGIAAILCGYPTLPNVIVVNQPDKYIKLPCFPYALQKEGYYTSFDFGGQLCYGNIKGLIYYNKFNNIYEGENFPASIPRGRLGVHDEYLLISWLGRLRTFPQPFFAAAFTLSSHSPYDHPFPEVFNWGGDENDFINSAYYTDSCLGDFFKKAKNQLWYNNTLFILVSDHSHGSPKGWNLWSKNYRHIPLLFYGEVLKSEYRGVVNNITGSQTDLSVTLLKQLGIDISPYRWSKNLLNPYSQKFAFFAFDEGLGWTDEHNNFILKFDNNEYIEAGFSKSSDSIRTVTSGKSYLQVLFQEYLDF